MNTIHNTRLIRPSRNSSTFLAIIGTIDVQLGTNPTVNSVLARGFSVTFEKTDLQIERKQLAIMLTSFLALALCFGFEKFLVLFPCLSDQNIKQANDSVHWMGENIDCVNVVGHTSQVNQIRKMSSSLVKKILL